VRRRQGNHEKGWGLLPALKNGQPPDSDAQKQALTSFQLLLSYLNEDTTMLWTIAAIFMALWLVGLTSAHTLAGFLHVLLVVSVVLVLFNLAVGRQRPL
jgi:hypothetical protein